MTIIAYQRNKKNMSCFIDTSLGRSSTLWFTTNYDGHCIVLVLGNSPVLVWWNSYARAQTTYQYWQIRHEAYSLRAYYHNIVMTLYSQLNFYSLYYSSVHYPPILKSFFLRERKSYMHWHFERTQTRLYDVQPVESTV